jgi:membrane associated rhomboid family serine protease
MPFIEYLLPVLYILGLYSAYLAGFLYLRIRSASKPVTLRPPWATLLLFLMIAIPTTLQFIFPRLLPLFQRDPTRFMNGEWWRLITPLFFQDGGIGGAISNLVGLLLIGFVAEQLWGRRSMSLIFFLGAIVGELVGLAWQPIGAGNSVANFSLAGSVAVICLLRRPPRPVQIAALVALGADVLLVLLQDSHGPAALAGAVLALVLIRISNRKENLNTV